jgi:putative ABC transport system permease protein
VSRRILFWIRWTWRDLRARWVQVLVIALIIGLGTGLYSGLASTSAWRRASYDASYQATHMFDLRVTLATGSYAPAADLVRAMKAIPASEDLVGVSARLIGSTQLDASTRSRQILVPATVVGIDVSAGAPPVSDLAVLAGRGLRPTDDGQPVAVLNAHLGRYFHLPAEGTLEVSGRHALRYVGHGVMPEDFVVFSQQHYEQTANAYGIVYTSLTTAGDLLGQAGQANDASIRLRSGADAVAVRRQLEAAVSAAFPGIGATWTSRADDPGRKQLYGALTSTQRLYNIFAGLVLAGAVFGAFNLTVRIVEAQRREIGVAMALGTPTELIAARPILVGLEVAVAGAAMGVGVGIGVNQLFIGAVRSFLPLPVWVTTFQSGIFLRGALIGIALTMVAVAIPVIRAVRVAPIEAIRTTAVSASGVGLSPLLARLPLPGNSLVQLPFRNVLRAPRRTLLTALGIAAAITILVCLLGMSDSFFATIDSARRDVRTGASNRMTVSLDRFRLTEDPAVEAIRHAPGVARSETQLEVLGSLSRRGTTFDVLLTALDLHGGMWKPRLIAGTTEADHPGLVISEKAAADLGVVPGDIVTLHHPRRTGLTSYGFVDTPIEVIGVSSLPTRFLAYLDIRQVGMMNLAGVTNTLEVAPQGGVSTDALQRTLFALPGVGFVLSPLATIDAARTQIDEVLAILRVADGALLLMVGLIAFNATSINVDERRREEATMFAFGVPVRTVVAIAVAESLVSGLIGTLLGIAAGRALLHWLTTSVMPGIIEDIAIHDVLDVSTILLALGLGVLAVAVAPVLSGRRLARMDIPSTLRVME